MYFEAPLPSDLSNFLVGLQSALDGFHEKLDAIRAEMEPKSSNPAPERLWFKVGEAAKKLRKSEYTVREWCRDGRINACKGEARRGREQLWMIHRDEIQRFELYGSLPFDPTRNKED